MKNKTLEIIASFLFLAFLILYFLHPIPLQGTNVDLGHHLLLGEITWKEKSVPQTNIISFTEPDYVFVNNQWLSEVVFYQVKQFFGFNGLIFLSVGIAALTFLILTNYMKEKIIYSSIVGIFYLQILLDRTEVKPEIFSNILVAFFIFALYKFYDKKKSMIFLLPILMALWINFHIFFIVGLAITAIFALDILHKNKFKLKNPQAKKITLILIATAFATLINPNFIRGTLYPFHVLSNYGYEVIENLNFLEAITKGYADITFLYFFIAVIILWFGLFRYAKRLERIDIYLSLFFTLFSLFAVRNFPIFVFGTFIPMVKITKYFVDEISKSTTFSTQKITLILLGTIILISSPAIFTNFKLHGLGLGVIDEGNAAVNFLVKNNIKGPIFNNYNIGNYLEYRLYPKEKIFVDGNPEQYPFSFFENVYYQMEGNFSSFEKLSKRYNINLVFYEHKNQTQNTNPLLSSLIKSADWKLIFLDNRIVIFIKNIPQNKDVIDKFLKTEKNISTKKFETLDKDKIGDLSNLFRILEWYHPMLQMDLMYLKHDPKNCLSLRHVAALKIKFNENDYPRYLNLFNKYCST